MTENVVFCRTSAVHTASASASPLILLKSSPTSVVTYLKMKMDAYEHTFTEENNKFTFEFVDDPKIYGIEPSETIRSGGLTMRVSGRDFDTLQTVHLIVSATPLLLTSTSNVNGGDVMPAPFFKSECAILSSSFIECVIPQIRDNRSANQEFASGSNSEESSSSLSSSSSSSSLEYSIYIQFNEIGNKFANRYAGDLQRIQVYSDPVFEEAQLFSDKTPIILIKGKQIRILITTFKNPFKIIQTKSDVILHCF